MLHSLTVNTLNFCAFAMCGESLPAQEPDDETESIGESVIVAVPGIKDTEIDIFQLPSEKRLYKVPALPNKTGELLLYTRRQRLICNKGKRLNIEQV